MQTLNFYQRVYGTNDPDHIFEFFLANLKPSNKLWDYFVDWVKVSKNIQQIEAALNIFNYLIGKADFDNEFRFLLKRYPEIVEIIPMLLAHRTDKKVHHFEILINYQDKKLIFEKYDFSPPTTMSEANIEKYLYFVDKTGIKKLITDGKIKNFTDYITGVEVGLGSNGRKNRSGKAMENIVKVFIDDICLKKRFVTLAQAKTATLLQEWGCRVPIDKAGRSYDFAIKTQASKLFLVETNFYNGDGSKLKATAGEYMRLNDTLREKGCSLIWITDGPGWKASYKQLNEAFDNNDYIFNLSMLENGILDEVLS